MVTNKQTITQTGNHKTHEGWDESLGTYLHAGDSVDEEMYDYVLGVLPPAYWRGGLLQMGEASDHRGAGGRARFLTLQKYDGQWIYTGDQCCGVRVEITGKG